MTDAARANALGNLGIAYKNLGKMRKASEFYEQHRDIAREIGDRRGEGNASFNMALALDKLDEHAQAIAHAEAALKIFEAIEDPNAEMVRQTVGGMERQTLNGLLSGHADRNGHLRSAASVDTMTK